MQERESVTHAAKRPGDRPTMLEVLQMKVWRKDGDACVRGARAGTAQAPTRR